ncbi:hypothetical protein acdb102_04840 [Acidothermaceae bacterium B102]|nr:hypothetical protein acdb102_04840 [Acidothermaceae bacterium B102]
MALLHRPRAYGVLLRGWTPSDKKSKEGLCPSDASHRDRQAPMAEVQQGRARTDAAPPSHRQAPIRHQPCHQSVKSGSHAAV